jgi:pyruvate kinase
MAGGRTATGAIDHRNLDRSRVLLMSRRTRIVATLGPTTDPPDVLRRLLMAGVDVARINFSHGSADEHLARIARLRETAAALKRNVAVLADLPGPKLRVRLPPRGSWRPATKSRSARRPSHQRPTSSP